MGLWLLNIITLGQEIIGSKKTENHNFKKFYKIQTRIHRQHQSDRVPYLPCAQEASQDVVLVHPVLKVPDPERPDLVSRSGGDRRGRRGVVRLRGWRLPVVRLRRRLAPHRRRLLRRRCAVLLRHRWRDPAPLRWLPATGLRRRRRRHARLRLRRRGLLHHGDLARRP
jgi:hypothetical protein